MKGSSSVRSMLAAAALVSALSAAASYESDKAAEYAAMSPQARAAEIRSISRRICDLELMPPVVRTDVPARFKFKKLDFAMNAGMTITRGGRIYAIWFAGQDGVRCFVVGSWSDDGGKTWADTQFFIGSPDPIFKIGFTPTYLTTITGNIWAAPDGTLRIYTHQAVDGFDARGALFEIICRNPDDARPTWGKARFISWGQHHNTPIVLRDGTWVLPNSFENFCQREDIFPELADKRGVGILASTDNGKTWERRGFTDPAKVGAWHFCEHMIVEKGDGTLWMLIRTGNLKLMESFSRDQGRTWSDPVKTVNIAQISARFGFAKLPNGHLVFIKNGTTPTVETTSREKLCAFVSDDEGLTWKGGLLIDERKRVCYPDTNVAPDGSIYITYDHDRNTKNRDELLMARFTEADILAGRIVTEGSFLKRVVFQEKGGTTSMASR